jgi:hypothetical protein
MCGVVHVVDRLTWEDPYEAFAYGPVNWLR